MTSLRPPMFAVLVAGAMLLATMTSCGTMEPGSRPKQPTPPLGSSDQLNKGPPSKPTEEQVTFGAPILDRTVSYVVQKVISIRREGGYLSSVRLEYQLTQRILPVDQDYRVVSEIQDFSVSGYLPETTVFQEGSKYTGIPSDYLGLVEGSGDLDSKMELVRYIATVQEGESFEKVGRAPELVSQRIGRVVHALEDQWARMYGLWMGKTFRCGRDAVEAAPFGCSSLWIPTTSATVPCERKITVVHRGSGDDYHIRMVDTPVKAVGGLRSAGFVNSDLYTTSGLDLKRLLVEGTFSFPMDDGKMYWVEIYASMEKS